MTSPVPSESCRTSSPARKVAPLPEPAAPQSIPQIVPAAPDSAPWFKWKLLPDLSSTTAPELALGPSPPPPAECPARKRRRRSAQLDENTGSDLFGKETSDEDIIGGDPFVGIPVAQAGQEVEPHYAILNGCSQSTWEVEFEERMRIQKTDRVEMNLTSVKEPGGRGKCGSETHNLHIRFSENTRFQTPSFSFFPLLFPFTKDLNPSSLTPPLPSPITKFPHSKYWLHPPSSPFPDPKPKSQIQASYSPISLFHLNLFRASLLVYVWRAIDFRGGKGEERASQSLFFNPGNLDLP